MEWTWGVWKQIRFRPFVLTLVGLAFLWFGYQLRAVFNPLLVGLLVAYILNPAVAFFSRRLGVPRVIVIGLLFVGLAAAAAVVVSFAVPLLLHQVGLAYWLVVGEPFQDANGNGVCDADEAFEDRLPDGRYNRGLIPFLLETLELMGLFGLLLAVPLFCTIKILVEEMLLPPLRALADEKPIAEDNRPREP